jgi:hypothetical protein
MTKSRVVKKGGGVWVKAGFTQYREREGLK